MIGLIITGHGHFADGLHTSAKMIAGESELVKYINFEDGMSTETLAEKYNAAINEFDNVDGIVVMADLVGGSPFNTAVQVAMTHTDKKIEVLAGTNLPMIITAVNMVEFEEDPKSLAEEMVTTGQECIEMFKLVVREEVEEEDEDGI